MAYTSKDEQAQLLQKVLAATDIDAEEEEEKEGGSGRMHVCIMSSESPIFTNLNALPIVRESLPERSIIYFGISDICICLYELRKFSKKSVSHYFLFVYNIMKGLDFPVCSLSLLLSRLLKNAIATVFSSVDVGSEILVMLIQ